MYSGQQKTPQIVAFFVGEKQAVLMRDESLPLTQRTVDLTRPVVP